MNKMLLIDKPKGITSYDVIRSLKTQYLGEKIGHAGTLDPNATGLMIIGIGKGTKELRKYVGLDKTYEAKILLGIQTDSGDIDGKILKEERVGVIDEGKIKESIAELVGKHILPVSKYSATKVRGVPAHRRARRGEHVPNLKREMEIYSAKLLKIEPLTIELAVSSGTYIRSIAEELGKKLSTLATLKNLRRTKVGDFDVKDAEKIEGQTNRLPTQDA